VKIGLSGFIGSGKSTVASLARAAGYPVLDADAEAHVLYKNNLAVRTAMSQTFGANILTADGVDRKVLGSLVFSDEARLLQLESIIHPALSEHLLRTLQKPVTGVLFLEGALLPRWPALLQQLDQVWDVRAPAEQRLQRIIARGLPPQEAQRRIAQQESMPPLQHHELVVIDNSGTPADMERRVQNLFAKLANK